MKFRKASNINTLSKSAAVLLTVAVVFSALSLVACKGKVATSDESGTDYIEQESDGLEYYYFDDSTPLNLAIVAAPKILATELIEDSNNPSLTRRMVDTHSKADFQITEAILMQTVDNVIASGVTAAVIVGDLTEDGSVTSMNVVAGECARLEAAGISTFVMNGVSDTYINAHPVRYAADGGTVPIETCTVEKYKDIMGAYSVGVAVDTFDGTLSYAADVPGSDYRIITIDTASLYDSEDLDYSRRPAPDMPREMLDWIEDALADCEKHGKTPIVLSYFPLSTDAHPLFGNACNSMYLTLSDGDKVLELLAKYNVTTVLSAHCKAEAYYEYNVNGNKICELSSSDLCTLPSITKYAKVYSGGISFISDFPDAVKAEYIPSYIPENEVETITADLHGYSSFWYVNGMVNTIHTTAMYSDKYEMPAALCNLKRLHMYATSNVSPASNHKLEATSEKIADWMYEIDHMPLYGEGNTVEAICKPYGISVPESDYARVDNFICDIIVASQYGILEHTKGDDLSQIFKAIFCAGILKLGELELFDDFHDAHDFVKTCNLSEVVDSALKTGIIDLKQNDLILSITSMLTALMQSNPILSVLSGILDAKSSEEMLGKFKMLSPALTFFSPEIVIFAGENKDFESSFMSISKGEIYIDAFVDDVLFDVTVATGLLT